MTHPHLYRGHRRQSFVAADINELVELRARQRTFYGAYSRTALANLGSSLMILRLFDRRFYQIGVLFAVLGTAMFIVSYLRARHSQHDFADSSGMNPRRQARKPIQTKGQEGARIFGRPFVTAGWIVLAVATIVAVVEIALLILVLRLDPVPHY